MQRTDHRQRLTARLRMLAFATVLAALLHPAVPVQAQVTPTGSLSNFDVRYPPSLPNDLDIYLYSDGISCEDVVWTWNTDNLLDGPPPVGLQWGRPACLGPTINLDPTSPGFGLDCIRIRYSGPQRPDIIGRMVHGGIHLRPGVQVEHQEIWWTLNGERITRSCDPHIRWVWNERTLTWIICIANPTPEPFYIYGYRWFLPQPANPLPTLPELLTDIDPERFGTQWQQVPEVAPGLPFPRIICIPPWCRVYVRVKIPITICRPIIFQLAVANQEITDPPPFPMPDDERTVLIMTSRATEQPPGDVNDDGATGAPDLARLRAGFGQRSVDLDPPDDPDPNPTGDEDPTPTGTPPALRTINRR